LPHSARGKSRRPTIPTRPYKVEGSLAVKTAETHRSNIMRKLGLHSISELVLHAERNNTIQVTPDLATASADTKAKASPSAQAISF